MVAKRCIAKKQVFRDNAHIDVQYEHSLLGGRTFEIGHLANEGHALSRPWRCGLRQERRAQLSRPAFLAQPDCASCNIQTPPTTTQPTLSTPQPPKPICEADHQGITQQVINQQTLQAKPRSASFMSGPIENLKSFGTLLRPARGLSTLANCTVAYAALPDSAVLIRRLAPQCSATARTPGALS